MLGSKFFKKNSSSKVMQSEYKSHDISSAYTKAKEMEHGFVKSRKAVKKNEEDEHKFDTLNTVDEKPDFSNLDVQEEEVKKENEDLLPVKKEAEKKEIFSLDTVAESDTLEIKTSPVKEGYQVSLSPSLCLTLFVTAVITLAFVFLFGLIIGKGMMSEPDLESSENINMHDEQKNNASNSDLVGDKKLSEEYEKVLPAEELKFLTNLKKETEKEPEKTIEDDKKIDQPEKKQEVDPADQIFDYTVQVAAFRNADQADILREKLEGEGFRTLKKTNKDSKGNWYLVNVLMRANQERFLENVSLFKKFAIKDYLIKGKVPVE